MSNRNLYVSTALGLCLGVAPLGAVAQPAGTGSAGTGPAQTGLFAPAVQACIDGPTVTTCQDVRAVVAECAADLDYARCEVLIEDADEVFNDPAQFEAAHGALSQASEAIAGMTFDVAEGAPGDLSDAVRADAERTMLRGEENPAVHSSPPLIVGDEAEPEASLAEPSAETAPAAETPVTEAPVTEDANPVRDSAEADVALAAEDEADAEASADAAADSETPVAGADDDATAAQRLREALEAEARAEADAPTDAADAETTPDAATLDPAAAALEEERASLRAEAEAMAVEEPELVVEDAPEQEFTAPADAPRTLDATQQGALDRLMDNPEIAAAVAILGGMAVAGDAQQPSSGALSALRLDRGDGTGRDDGVAAAPPAEVIEQSLTADQIRTSRDDFGSRLALDFDAGQARAEDSGDLQRAGLAALGALAVGMVVDRNRVVARSDERVVVMRDDGEYAVWRDDDAMMRQAGTDRRIERFDDGSTLTRWTQPDGAQIVTVRDATGRVLLRERIAQDGTAVTLVDDMREIAPVEVSLLPPPRTRELRMSQRTDPELALALLQEAEADARGLGRSFSLRQIREIREVRELAPVLSPDPITFEVNRANVRAEEARKLSQVGRLIERLIADNPRELFLVEGHTDATGPASGNLALSDRRAESVALALTEFFDIPAENLIIQGYGERHLRVPTAASEERNRRVAIRRVSTLMGL